jgi:hypothetical protein
LAECDAVNVEVVGSSPTPGAHSQRSPMGFDMPGRACGAHMGESSDASRTMCVWPSRSCFVAPRAAPTQERSAGLS